MSDEESEHEEAEEVEAENKSGIFFDLCLKFIKKYFVENEDGEEEEKSEHGEEEAEDEVEDNSLMFI